MNPRAAVAILGAVVAVLLLGVIAQLFAPALGTRVFLLF
jgi:preprotein translocase subunit Sec61beta